MYYPLIMSMNKATVDADAQLFITNAGITDTTQKSAINTLVKDLKTYGIWSKMKAIYPFVGGTAAQHRFNLKDPRTVDAAFYLTFGGGGTHDANGYTGNAINSFADTKMDASSKLTLWNTHLSYYSRTSTLEVGTNEMGSYDGITNDLFCLSLPRTTGRATSIQYDQSADAYMAFATGLTSAAGLWVGNRTSSAGNSHKLFKNGSVIGTASSSQGSFSNYSIYINALRNANNPTIFSSGKNCAFASIGDGLSDAEATNLYTSVQAYQVALGGVRAV